MKKLILPLLLLLLPSLCFADASTGVISLTNVKIEIITDPSNSRVYIYVTLNGGCAGTTPEIVMTSANPVAAAMYSTLLFAQATGESVSISTTGCTSDADEPEVTAINLEP